MPGKHPKVPASFVSGWLINNSSTYKEHWLALSNKLVLGVSADWSFRTGWTFQVQNWARYSNTNWHFWLQDECPVLANGKSQTTYAELCKVYVFVQVIVRVDTLRYYLANWWLEIIYTFIYSVIAKSILIRLQGPTLGSKYFSWNACFMPSLLHLDSLYKSWINDLEIWKDN